MGEKIGDDAFFTTMGALYFICGIGMCVVVDEGRMVGVFTDGDLRRVLDREINVHKSTMREVMTRVSHRFTCR